jgi:cysteine-rich repeat protein
MSQRCFILALFWLLSACSDPDPRTQITFVLDAAEPLRAQIASLSVSVQSDRWSDGDTFSGNELTWPVDFVVLPKGSNDASRSVTFSATAFDASRRQIARWELARRFVPRKHVSQPIPVMAVDQLPGDAGSGAADAGLDGGAARDAAGGPDAQHPTEDAQGPSADGAPGPGLEDASSGAANCRTAGTTIRCDDGNGCNGTERCEPANAGADERGCVSGEDVVRCMDDSTCDRATGKCSTCLVKPDGDGDGVRSVSCGGNDCDDNDDAIAPGKSELCDGKDNDCNGTVDAREASADCPAPRNGSAACEMGRCTQRCTDPSQQIENGACVAPQGTCPIINPCAPGRCVPGRGSYACECSSGFRAGLTRCAPSGVKRRTVGFETTCDGMATPGSFVMGMKSVPASLYASCGVAVLSSSGLMGQAQLFEPGMVPLEGMTGTVALAGTPPAMGATSEITINFSPSVNEVAFDVLDIDVAGALHVLVEDADGMDLLDMRPQPTAESKRVRVAHSSATPIARVTLSYTRGAADDGWYVDELTFDVWGCGDGERDMALNEACDDGNSVQCDGCDNGCVVSQVGCLDSSACVADGTKNGCTVCDVTMRAAADQDAIPVRDPLGGSACPP